MQAGKAMKKLDDSVRRLHMIVPTSLIKKVDRWRQQDSEVPNLSEAIRRLIEAGLESSKKTGKPAR